MRMARCSSTDQQQNWQLQSNSSLLRHSSSGDKCLAANVQGGLLLESCDSSSNRQRWTLQGNTLKLAVDGSCLAVRSRANYLRGTFSYTARAVACSRTDHRHMEMRAWSPCHVQYSCSGCTGLLNPTSPDRAMCQWKESRRGSHCCELAETCAGSAVETCKRPVVSWLGTTTLVVLLVIGGLAFCYYHRATIANVLAAGAKVNPIVGEEPTDASHPAPAQGSSYRMRRNEPSELRPGQQELMDLRRQWHAQRAAREAARETEEAAYLDRLDGLEEPGGQERRAAWELEQDLILRELAERASAMERLPMVLGHGALVVAPHVVEAVHREIDALGSTVATAEMAKAGELCCICMCDYAAGEDLRRLRCGHLFHCRCIKDWVSRASVCPVCKDELQPKALLAPSIDIDEGDEAPPAMGSPVLVHAGDEGDSQARLGQAAPGERGLGYLRAYLRENQIRNTGLAASVGHERQPGGQLDDDLDDDARRAIARFRHGPQN